MFSFLKYIFASFLHFYYNSHLFRILNLIRSLQWKWTSLTSRQQLMPQKLVQIYQPQLWTGLGWTGLGGEKDKPPPRLKWFLARWVHFVLRQEPGTEGEVLLA